jgi:phosphotransacetylase
MLASSSLRGALVDDIVYTLALTAIQSRAE